MRTKQGNMGIGVGGISILAIFVVLCLATLAALSLTSAQADYTLAQKTADAATGYYEAEAKAEEKLAELMEIAEGNQNWKSDLKKAGFTVEETGNGLIVTYSVPIDEIKTLEASIRLSQDEGGVPTGEWVREQWRTNILEEASSSSETLNLLK